MASERYSHEPDELDLRDYWYVLQRRWRIVAFTTFVVFVLGALFTFLQTPIYRARATILVEDQKGSQLDILEGLSSIGGAIPVETEMEILKSRTIAEDVVRDLGLDAVPINAPMGTFVRLRDYSTTSFLAEDAPEFRLTFGPNHTYTAFDEDGNKLGVGVLGAPFSGAAVSWRLDVTMPTEIDSLRFRKMRFDEAVRAFREKVSVREVGKKTNVIEVTVDGPDSFLVRRAADRLTDAYLAYNIARKSQVASQTLDFLTEQLDAIRGNLEAGEQELGNYKSNLGIFVLSDSAKNIIEQIGRLETAKAELELQRREVSALADALQKAGDRDGPYLLGQVSLPDQLVVQLVGDLSKSLIELRGVRQELSEDNPKVALLRSQVDEAKAKVRQAVENAGRSLAGREATAAKLIESYEARLRTLPESERRLAILTRKSEVNAELYTFLLKKHEEARITRAGIIGNVRVLDDALVPDEPESPKKKRNLLLILLLGLVGGVAFAFLLEYLDDSLKTIDEVSTALGLGVYGVIPYVEHPTDQPVVIHKLDGRGVVQEAFRSFRTNVQFTDSEHRVKSILAVSALPGVGKSTTMVNLAVVLAQGGSRVLLVDCDLRRPQIHRFFEMPSEPGLTNALLGDQSWVSYVVENTDVPHLSVLPAGVLPPNPTEFLGSHRFQKFMDEAATHFDFVVYDVPPIVAFTDAALLAARADAVFMIMELGRTRLPLIRRALELLANVQARVRGVVVNKAISFGPDDHAYGYYGYGLSHYYEQERSEPTRLRRLWERWKG